MNVVRHVYTPEGECFCVCDPQLNAQAHMSGCAPNGAPDLQGRVWLLMEQLHEEAVVRGVYLDEDAANAEAARRGDHFEVEVHAVIGSR